MPYDYTDAPPQRDLELIPTAPLQPCHAYPRRRCRRGRPAQTLSKDGDCEMLDVEFAVFDGPHKASQVLGVLWILPAPPMGTLERRDDRGTLKAILDCALGLKPDDIESRRHAPPARSSLKQFDGKTFIAKDRC